MTLRLPVGTRYSLLRQLAVGGMAEVHLGRARLPGGMEMRVALKRVRPDLPDEYTTMFLDEVRLVERLEHPNLPWVLDTTQARVQRYYVMEYLWGRDGRQLTLEAERRGRPVGIELAVPIAIAACDGLEHAHRCTDAWGRPLGIVHRDVSPANLFVTADGRIKVIDFGIASWSHRSSETQAGIVKGKLRYMSPEQFRLVELDGRSDVFSLATVLWEMTVGRRPFDSDSDIAVLRAICETDAPRPSQERPDYPPELERIVLRGLARDRDERFGSAAELGAALREFAAARAIDCSTTAVAQALAAWLPADEPTAGARYRFYPDGRAALPPESGSVTHERGLTMPWTTLRGEATVVDPVMEMQ